MWSFFFYNSLTWKVHEQGGQEKLEDNCQEGNDQDQDHYDDDDDDGDDDDDDDYDDDNDDHDNDDNNDNYPQWTSMWEIASLYETSIDSSPESIFASVRTLIFALVTFNNKIGIGKNIFIALARTFCLHVNVSTWTQCLSS